VLLCLWSNLYDYIVSSFPVFEFILSFNVFSACLNFGILGYDVCAIFSIVISVGTLNIISLGFLSLGFVNSRRSPSLVLTSVVSLFISSLLPVSTKIPFSLIVLIALIPTLKSVGLIYLFSWFLICSGVRDSAFGIRVNLCFCFLFFSNL